MRDQSLPGFVDGLWEMKTKRKGSDGGKRGIGRRGMKKKERGSWNENEERRRMREGRAKNQG